MTLDKTSILTNIKIDFQKSDAYEQQSGDIKINFVGIKGCHLERDTYQTSQIQVYSP